MAETTPAPTYRSDRILRNVTWSTIGLSIVAMVSLLIARAGGVSDFSHGIWPTLAILPLIGFPIGILLLVAQLVVSAVRRSRAAKDAAE